MIPLKGAHLISSVYPEGEDRGRLGDVDFLVRPESFGEVDALLIHQGFRREVLEPYQTEKHEASYVLDVGSQNLIAFEVHRALSRFPLDQEGIWGRARPGVFDGVPCLYLSAEDTYVYLVLHELFHRFSGLSRTVRDLTMLLRYQSVDTVQVISRAREWRLTRAVWTLSRLVGQTDASLGLDEMLRELRPDALTRKVIEYLVPDEHATRLFKLHHRLQALLLWTWLLDRKTQLIRRAITHPYLQYLSERVAKRRTTS